MKWGRRSRASEEDPGDLGCAVREERVDPKRASRRHGERGTNGGKPQQEDLLSWWAWLSFSVEGWKTHMVQGIRCALVQVFPMSASI